MNHSRSLFVALCLATVATAQTIRPAGVTTLMLAADIANGIAGATTQIIGFVVSGTLGKPLLGRAVGPSLRPFGIAKPVSQPRIHFFDSSGKEIGFGHPAVVVDMAAFFASVGAFPLTGGESSFDYGSFAPGNYTIHVSDQSGQGGTVLVEVYEFSTSPAPPTPTPPVAPPGLGG